MVVSRGRRHHLRDAERLDLVGWRVRPLDRVRERPAGDDRPLARQQAGDRGDRPDAARVGQGDVRALEVVSGELVLARLGDQLLVVGVKAAEVEAVGALDARHHQAALPLALDVDGNPEVDRARLDDERLVVSLLEVARHHRPVLRRLDDRPGDQVREADLHPALGEDPVERLALGVERVDRERPERGRGRYLPAVVHRLGERGRGAAQSLGLAVRRRCLRDGSRGRAVAVCGEHVGLGHLAAGAGALDA